MAVAIVLATLGALWLVLRAVTIWAALPANGPRRRLPMFTSPEANIDVKSDGDGAHHHGGSVDHAGDGGGHGGDAGGDGSGDGGH